MASCAIFVILYVNIFLTCLCIYGNKECMKQLVVLLIKHNSKMEAETQYHRITFIFYSVPAL